MPRRRPVHGRAGVVVGVGEVELDAQRLLLGRRRRVARDLAVDAVRLGELGDEVFEHGVEAVPVEKLGAVVHPRGQIAGVAALNDVVAVRRLGGEQRTEPVLVNSGRLSPVFHSQKNGPETTEDDDILSVGIIKTATSGPIRLEMRHVKATNNPKP